MNWKHPTLACAGLCVFGHALGAKLQGQSPGEGWFWTGTLGLALVNAGICLVVEAAKKR